MKKKKTILFIAVLVAVIGALNLMQPFQNAIAYPCNPWDPGYDFLTGECPDPPDYEVDSDGGPCMVWELGVEVNVGDAVTCTWAVVGTCNPVSCDELAAAHFGW